MSEPRSRLRRLGWKPWLLMAVPLVVPLVILAVVPTVYYYSRSRSPLDYSDMLAEVTVTYSVTYDSGEGQADECILTRKVTETQVREQSQTCFHVVTEYDPFPSRRVNTLLGPRTLKVGGDEIWRNAANLRVVKKVSLHTNVPIVNTVQTTTTYSHYSGYPGWPYHQGDRWTYRASYDPDTDLMSPWTETFQAEVVSDNAVVQVGDSQYQCFEVVHTLVATTNRYPSGSSAGGTITEYWHNGGKSIGPIKVEDALNYRGIEILTVTADMDLPQF